MNKVIDFFKQIIAGIIVKRNLKKPDKIQSFNDFFKKSFKFMVIMPEDESDFQKAFQVLEFLKSKDKNVSAFTKDFKVSLLPQKFKGSAIGYSILEVSKWNLPSHKLINNLKRMNFDVVLDLNRKPNLFYSFSANLVNAPVRAGFKNGTSDQYYNIQIINKPGSAENSYKNFINCLEMF